MNRFKDFWKNLITPMPTESAMSNYTPRAQQVFTLARKEADRLNHNVLGTEHLLLGLVALGQGTAVDVLIKMGINLETVQAEVEKQIGTATDQKTIGNVPYTPGVRKVLSQAKEEAKCLNHPCVSTGHILLGLLREGDGVAARVLKKQDIDIERTRGEVLKLLEPAKCQSSSETAKGNTSSSTDGVGFHFWGRKLAESRQSLPNFTPRAQEALALSEKEAERFNHNFVGTEHLLLGLIALGQGVAVNVFQKLGLDLKTLREEVEKHVGKGPDQKVIGKIPYTPRVKKVLALANKERKTLNHTYLGTEHILLGLLREGDGVAARVLKKLEVDIERTREEILKVLNPNSEPSTAATGTSASQPSKPSGQSEEAFGCFTPRAQKVMALAREEAVRFGHSFVGTEHLLFGLIALGHGVAVNVLLRSGVGLETVRKEIEKQVGVGPEVPDPAGIPYAPQVKKALALAVSEARNLNHTYIGTEHILLGLLQEDDGMAAHILKNLNVDRQKMREEILRELAPVYTTKPVTASAQPTMPSPVQIPNFTPRAQRVLALARKEADRFKHNFVGTEHLLLGIIKLGQGTAVAVLTKMGLDLDNLRKETEKSIGAGPDQKIIGNIPYTPRVKKVLALGAKEAMALKHNHVGTEHILLGLLREGDGVAARILNNHNVELEDTRQEILKELGSNT